MVHVHASVRVCDVCLHSSLLCVMYVYMHACICVSAHACVCVSVSVCLCLCVANTSKDIVGGTTPFVLPTGY